MPPTRWNWEKKFHSITSTKTSTSPSSRSPNKNTKNEWKRTEKAQKIQHEYLRSSPNTNRQLKKLFFLSFLLPILFFFGFFFYVIFESKRARNIEHVEKSGDKRDLYAKFHFQISFLCLVRRNEDNWEVGVVGQPKRGWREG